MPEFISKSKYISGLQCPKLLWTQINEPEEIPEPDIVTQYAFDQGHVVGEYAKRLFPGGIDIPQDDLLENVGRTKDLLAERKPLFEAGILSGKIYSRLDILNPNNKDEWDIIEIKSSTSVKDVHIDDVSFQKHCCEQAGFQAARTNSADILVTLDGDGQHNPDEIPALISPITEGKADLVIGSRFPQPHLNQSQLISINLNHVPKYRKLGIDVITWLYNFGSKMKVSDSQSCFRAHSRKLLQAIEITEPGFGFSVEVLIKARRNGLAIMEVPISCIYHPQGSTDNPITHGLGVAFTVMKLRLFKHQEIIS